MRKSLVLMFMLVLVLLLAGNQVVLALAGFLFHPATVGGNPAHSAGDYFMFAKAAGDGDTSDPKAYEPVCNGGVRLILIHPQENRVQVRDHFPITLAKITDFTTLFENIPAYAP